MLTMERIGRIIRQGREARGLTQEELARTAGISDNSVFWYEHKQAIPSAPTLDKILGILGIPLPIGEAPSGLDEGEVGRALRILDDTEGEEETAWAIGVAVGLVEAWLEASQSP